MVKLRRVRYIVFLSYIGRKFNGFQKQYNQVVFLYQPDLITVQDVVEEALSHMGFHRWYFSTGSRTDKDVNGLRHPVMIEVEDPEDKIYSCLTFKKALNSRLKETDVSVADVWFAKDSFINKFSVQQKIYEYNILANLQDDKDHVFVRVANVWALENQLDFEKLKAASQ